MLAHRRARIAVSAAFWIQGMVLATLLSKLAVFKSAHGLSETQLTLVVLSIAVVAGGGSLTFGALAQRVGSAWTLRAGIVLVSVAAGAAGFAPSFPTVVAAFVVYGFGVGGIDAAMNAQGVAVQALYGRSIMAGFHCVWSVAGVAGALYASGTAALGWSLGPTIGLLTLVGVATMLVSGPFFVRERPEAVSAAAGAGAGERVPWRPLLLVGVAVVVFYVMDSGGLNWSALYLQEALHASLTLAPLGLAGYQVGSIVCRAVADRLAIRFGTVRVVQAGTLLGMLGLLCIVAAPWPLLAIAGFFVTGLGLPVVAPFAFTAAAAASPGRPDVAIARLNLFNYAGTIIGSVLIGAVYAAGQLRLAFAIPLVLSGLILLVARAFAPRTPAAPAATVGETA